MDINHKQLALREAVANTVANMSKEWDLSANDVVGVLTVYIHEIIAALPRDDEEPGK